MANYDIAHLREQGQDMIIIPLDWSFGNRSQSEQKAVIDSLQACASSAGLAGAVVPVWDTGGGRMAFIAPRPWHPFFSSLDLGTVYANVNKTLTCR